jgi:hypothetical protein
MGQRCDVFDRRAGVEVGGDALDLACAEVGDIDLAGTESEPEKRRRPEIAHGLDFAVAIEPHQLVAIRSEVASPDDDVQNTTHHRNGRELGRSAGFQ